MDDLAAEVTYLVGLGAPWVGHYIRYYLAIGNIWHRSHQMFGRHHVGALQWHMAPGDCYLGFWQFHFDDLLVRRTLKFGLMNVWVLLGSCHAAIMCAVYRGSWCQWHQLHLDTKLSCCVCFCVPTLWQKLPLLKAQLREPQVRWTRAIQLSKGRKRDPI